MQKLSARTAIAAGLSTTLAIGMATALAASGATDNYPADKLTVAGSSFEVFGPTATGAAPAGEDNGHLLLQTHMRTSATEDLVLNVSSECDILTQIHNAGTDEDLEHAFAQVKFYLKIDGVTVPVSADDVDRPADDPQGANESGKVVFCNRTHDATSSFDDDSEFYEAYQETRSANSFQWVAMNVGNGIHEIQLFADFRAEVAGLNMTEDVAKAAVGKRTLVIEPTKAAPSETITAVS